MTGVSATGSYLPTKSRQKRLWRSYMLRHGHRQPKTEAVSGLRTEKNRAFSITAVDMGMRPKTGQFAGFSMGYPRSAQSRSRSRSIMSAFTLVKPARCSAANVGFMFGQFCHGQQPQ